MSNKIKEIIEQIESLTVIELNDLIKELEERFGVSGMPTFISGSGNAVSNETQEQEATPAKVTISLVDSGANKIQVIKALREINPQLGLKEAKEFVDNPPQIIKENISIEEANKIKEKIEAAGGKVEIK